MLNLSLLKAQTPGQPVPPLLKRCAAVLDPITKSISGLLEGLYLMARVKYLSGVCITVSKNVKIYMQHKRIKE